MNSVNNDDSTSIDKDTEETKEPTTIFKESDETIETAITESSSSYKNKKLSLSNQSSISSKYVINIEDDLDEIDDSEEEMNFYTQQTKNSDVRYFSSYYRNHKSRILVGIIFIAIIIFIVADSQTNNYVKKGFEIVMDWICKNPYLGMFVYTLICFIATVLFIPGLFITFGGAFIFACSFSYVAGIAIASACVFIGASLGAIASFTIGRYLMRNCAQKLCKRYKMLEAIDAALCTKGLRIMFLLRLSPVIPFNVLNYFAGVTAMSFKDNTISLLGILPGTVLFVFVGASAGKITETSMMMNNGGNSDTLTIIGISIGIVFAFFGVVATAFYARKELNKVLQRSHATEDVISDSDEDENNVNSINDIEVQS